MGEESGSGRVVMPRRYSQQVEPAPVAGQQTRYVPPDFRRLASSREEWIAANIVRGEN